MKAVEKQWIAIGYHAFAYDGPGSLKIERIAKAVNKNKSSFYHLFADLEIFVQRLLAFHLEQAKSIAEKEASARDEQQLIEVLVHHKVDLLFNRQLRVYRENPEFESCFNKTNQLTFTALMPVWKKIIGLTDNSSLAKTVLALSMENFYLQITDTTLNEQWLKAYFNSIRVMIDQFRTNNELKALDGSV